jgi:GDP-L-fucose synthase
MFFNMARCGRHFGRMIYFGSGAEFGREHWVPRMSEDYFDRHVPADQYGLSKYIMTKYAQGVKNICNLRLFAVFGKYEDWRVRIISHICRNAVLDEPIRIHQNRFYDFLSISDLTAIVRRFIDSPPPLTTYNVCTGQVVDFLTIAEKVGIISGKKLLVSLDREGLGAEYSGDSSLLLRDLGGFTFTEVDASLRSLYDWYAATTSPLRLGRPA